MTITFEDYVVRKPEDWPGLIKKLNYGWEIYWDDKAESAEGKVVFYFIINKERA